MAAETFKLKFTPRGKAAIDLSAALVSHNAAWGIKIASHSYLKRDGAEQEPMGAEAARVTYRLTFVGPTFASRYRALVSAIRAEPRGVLIDPLAGQIQVACRGISDASRDLRSAQNAVDVTITFEEDALDTSAEAEDAVSPASAVAAAKTKATLAQTAAAPFSTATFSVAAFVSAVQTLAAAHAAVLAGGVDLTLAVKLAAAGRAADVATAAVLGDPAGTGARAYAALSRIVDAYAACVQADQAVAGTRPRIIAYTVDGPVSVFVLAARLYGGALALQKAAEIMAGNRIPDPLWIASGTQLRLPQPSA